MSRRRTALAAALSLLPLGQPLLLGTLGITTATTAVVLQAPPAVAQDSSAVARIAKAITVRIEGATQGSGVLVKREGDRYTVLTAWHVVSGNRPGEELAIFTPDGKEHQLEQGSIQRLGQVDMAVLSFSSPAAYEVASIGDIKKVKYEDPIYVAGFPINNSQSLRYEPGEVVANAEIGIDQGYQLLYDNKTESGMSGGVLLNADGKLIGLHGRGERDEQASSGKELVMKTGVNQGVPITYYKLFDSGAPVDISKTTATTADDYLAQARASAGKKGREQTVIRLAEQSLKLRKTNEGYFLVGTNKFSSGDTQGAIYSLNKAIEVNQQDGIAYYNRGAVKAKLEDYQGAIADYNKAIAINPQFALAYHNRGVYKDELGDYQGAIADYNKAIESDPQYAYAYYNRGAVKGEKLVDYQGAIADYNKAIAINPQFAYAYNNRGRAKNNLKDHQGAIADYNKAIEINPKGANAYNNRGVAKFMTGDYQGAIADYNKVIEIDPQYARIYGALAAAKAMSGDDQGAFVDLNKAIEIDQSLLPSGYSLLGSLKFKKGDLEGACPLYKKGASLGSQSAVKWLNSTDGAWCRKAIEIDPQNAKTYNNLAIAKRKLDDYQGEIAESNKAIAINPKPADDQSSALYYGKSGNQKFSSGDYQGAISDYSKAIAVNPKDAKPYYNRGNAKVKSGDNQGAIADYNKAIAIDPQFASVYSSRGAAKVKSGDYQGAIADCNKAIAINPKDANAYTNRGLAKNNLKDYQGAIADCNKAIEINPKDANAYNNRGIAKNNLKDYQGAIADFNKAIEIDPQDATVYQNRGISKILSGDRKGACSDWTKSLSLGNKVTERMFAAMDLSWCLKMR